jgi:hypothetical protein
MKSIGLLVIAVFFYYGTLHAADWSREGEFLIDTNVVYTPEANSQHNPSIAFDGTNYLIVWVDDRPTWDYGFYGARVDQAGNVLDPVAIAISSELYSQIIGMAVAFDGANYLVTWCYGYSGAIMGARVDTAGTVLDTADICIIGLASTYLTDLSIAFDGTNYLVVYCEGFGWVNTINGIHVDTSGNFLGTIHGIAVSQWLDDPHVVFDGTNYLVVCGANGNGDWDIYGARVDTSGAVLDTVGIAISTAANDQTNPSVAFDGSNYLVVWEDYRSGSSLASDICGAKMNTSGVMIDSFAISLQSGDQISPALAHGMSDQVLVTYCGWTDSINGQPVDTMRIWGKFFPFVGIEDNDTRIVRQQELGATIFRGPLQLPEGKKCKVFDIEGC